MSAATGQAPAGFLPDFCRPAAVLAIVLITELVALVLTLARAGISTDASLWMDLGRLSLFLLWVGLGSAAVLCYGRRWLTAMPVPAATAAALALLMAVTLAVSEAAWWTGSYWDALLPWGLGRRPPEHAGFVARNLLICLVVSALALRYFYVAHQWKRNVELEASSRVNALQARIRPHFLFNSMNTIASLIAVNPDRAEDAVLDLSELFRASLRAGDRLIPLKDELDLCRRYLDIEGLRLGDRLTLHWDIAPDLDKQAIPPLTLQPLLENAIYHGIQPRPEGGTVTLEASHRGHFVYIMVQNPRPESTISKHDGNRMALANIQSRLQALFGDEAVLKHSHQNDVYTVTLRLPRRTANHTAGPDIEGSRNGS